MKYKYTMHNFATGQTVKKTQKAEPTLKGFTCVDRTRVLPEKNSRGEELFFDANNQPYYARVRADGFHYQP